MFSALFTTISCELLSCVKQDVLEFYGTASVLEGGLCAAELRHVIIPGVGII